MARTAGRESTTRHYVDTSVFTNRMRHASLASAVILRLTRGSSRLTYPAIYFLSHLAHVGGAVGSADLVRFPKGRYLQAVVQTVALAQRF